MKRLWKKQNTKQIYHYTIPKITICMGSINHQPGGCLWHFSSTLLIWVWVKIGQRVALKSSSIDLGPLDLTFRPMAMDHRIRISILHEIIPGSPQSSLAYSLANCYKTLKNHNFDGTNSLFLWPCSLTNCCHHQKLNIT